MTRERFHGTITGLGTTSGLRVVVGRWEHTPYGDFADVMLQTADDRRLLLAPTQQVAEFIEQTYTFDEVRITPVQVEQESEGLRVRAGDLDLSWQVGSRTAIGRLLRLVPGPVAVAPWWCRAVDPVARVVMRGVRTAGTARSGRSEFYGARDVRAVTRASGRYAGADIGALAPVDPPVSFGFGSTPAKPSQTSIVTTVVLRSATAQP